MNDQIYADRKQSYEAAIASENQLVPPAVFYSLHSAGLGLVLDPGHKHVEPDGKVHHIGYLAIEFTPLGVARQNNKDVVAQRFGVATVSDPKIALKLLQRCRVASNSSLPDICISDDFLGYCMSDEDKHKSTEARLLTSQNELQRVLSENAAKDAELQRLRQAMPPKTASPSGAKATA